MSWEGRENECPIDSHGLYALIAPRHVVGEHAMTDGCDPTFAVEGGYSGLTLYNADAVERTGCTFNGDERCEIVPFQACLRSRQLRIGLVPSLLQGCGAEHTLAANRTMLGKPRQNVFMSDKGAITYATRIQK